MLPDTPITTARLLLRALARADIGTRYLSWMQNPQVIRYLESRFQRFDVDKLVQFVESMNTNPDELFFGILPSKTGALISVPVRSTANIVTPPSAC